MTTYRQINNPNGGSAKKPSQKKDKNKAYLNEIKRQQQRQSVIIRMFVTIILFVLILLVAMFYIGVNTDFCNKHFGEEAAITKFFNKLANDNAKKSEAEFTLPFGPRRQNILLLGVDASENPDDLWTGTRTDTIILVNVDPRTKSVNAISIPRDSKVYLPGNHGIQKVNAAHAIGGIGMTIKTIEDTLGIKIDRYIMVHDNAVKSIVEALGGVDVYVEKNMNYDDYSGKLHIHLTKGTHHLSPTEAVGYLRFRHDPLGDIGRTQRQQWFLRGILNELKKPETITKIPEIVNVARQYVKTNMSFYELTQFAMMSKHLDMDKVEIAMLPGAPNKKGHISYWILDPEKTQEVVDRLIYREKVQPDEAVQMTASVVYSEQKTAEAQTIINELAAANVNVTCKSHISRAHSQFIAHSSQVTNEYFNYLKKQAPSITGYQFVFDPNTFPCGSSDFTIVVAGK